MRVPEGEGGRNRAKLSSETVKSAASAPGTLQTVTNTSNNTGANDPICEWIDKWINLLIYFYQIIDIWHYLLRRYTK